MTADGGSGYEEIVVRQDGTVGAMGAGVALIGAGDTLVGDRALSIDGAARTIQLGGGGRRDPGPPPANFTVGDENGATVNLDLSGWTGADFTTTLTGNASISLDRNDFTPVTFTETDMRLTDAETGAIIHVDTTQLFRSGTSS